MPPVHVELITPHVIWYLDWNFWVSFCTFALAVTTGYYAWETRRLRQGNDRALETTRAALRQQTEDTKRSLELAEMNAKAAAEGASATKQLTEIGQRPWVGHKEANYAFSSPAMGDPRMVNYRVECVLFNSGLSPALELRVGQQLQIFDKPIPDILDYPVFGPESSRAPLLPNETSITRCEEGFRATEIDAVNAGNKVLCIFGRALYADCFKQEHETKWCLVLNTRLQAFGYTNNHNSLT